MKVLSPEVLPAPVSNRVLRGSGTNVSITGNRVTKDKQLAIKPGALAPNSWNICGFERSGVIKLAPF